ncbi:MAG: hypothetical protein Q9169_004378 [Polycauliona sp. 2 TL-2023]
MTSPFSQVLKDPQFYQNTIYAISQIHTGKGYPCSDQSSYFSRPQKVRDRVELYDQIALLLTYTKRDAVAIGIETLGNGSRIAVVWAKNRPYTPSHQEKEYLDKLGESFRNLERPWKTLMLVLDQCREKIASRIKKLVKCVGDSSTGSNVFNISPDNPATEEFRQYLLSLEIMGDEPLVVGLDRFYQRCQEWNTTTGTNEGLKQLILTAYWLCHGQKTIEHLVGIRKEWFHRIKKIANYYRACVNIRFNLRHRTSARTFVFKQLQPPELEMFAPCGDTVAAANVWAERFGWPRIEGFSDIHEGYPNAKPGPLDLPSPGTINLTASQHCELTVAIHLCQKATNLHRYTNVEIGTSKRSCCYCAKWIAGFNRANSRRVGGPMLIHRGEEGGRRYDGAWIMPRQFTGVGERVLDDIGFVMQDIVDGATAPSRYADLITPASDVSWPPPFQEELHDGAGWFY